jgi:hypothetical protein
MSDNIAVLEGYTEGYLASCPEADLFILVKPGTDLDSTLKAWDSDNQEFIRINGWLWAFERTND